MSRRPFRISIVSAGLGGSTLTEISELTVHLDGLNRYQKTRADFIDCMIAATALANDVPVSTFDQDFRKFTDVHVEIE